jgi:hypothetical protein
MGPYAVGKNEDPKNNGRRGGCGLFLPGDAPEDRIGWNALIEPGLDAMKGIPKIFGTGWIRI